MPSAKFNEQLVQNQQNWQQDPMTAKMTGQSTEIENNNTEPLTGKTLEDWENYYNNISQYASTSEEKATAQDNLLNLWLQEQSWNRDDTAYQRAVQDLQKAGLNPWLAVSNSSGNSSVSYSSNYSETISKQQDRARDDIKNIISGIGTAAVLFKLLATLLA